MIHPLLRLAATQPQLLADHVEAYAGLVGEELGRSAVAYKQRLLLGALGLCLAVVAAVLAGVALMLWAATPPANLQAPWVLITAPGVAALLAAACALGARKKQADSFAGLKQQMSSDLAMLREVSAP